MYKGATISICTISYRFKGNCCRRFEINFEVSKNNWYRATTTNLHLNICPKCGITFKGEQFMTQQERLTALFKEMCFLGNTKRYSTYLRLKLHGGAIVSGAYSYYLRNRDEVLQYYGYSS
jgi:hypothetical protein